jgi:dTDP-4-dehydrorhamnose reductase
MKVLVLGPSGMLGAVMVSTLESAGFEITTAGRSDSDIYLNARTSNLTELALHHFRYIVNCVGLTTHNINEENAESVQTAKELNTDFPRKLSYAAEKNGVRLIQIATDCVYSGLQGGYIETDPHDATDVYGKTKSAGEVLSPNVMHIRSSIIGTEKKGKKSLLEWIIGQPQGVDIPGFTDRIWNGVTTLAFSKVVAGVMSDDKFEAGVSHLVPANRTSKFELVSLIARAFGRIDLTVFPLESGVTKDLTLSTIRPDRNLGFWLAAGYEGIPSVQELIGEISR